MASKQLHITMPETAYQALKNVASKQRRPVADVAREAIENYLHQQGSTEDVTIKRGGNRRGKED